MSRRHAREIALQVLFQLDIQKDEQHSPDEIVDQWAAEFALSPSYIPFAKDLVKGTLDHKEHIDRHLSELSTEWSISRMPGVDRNLLRLAAFEILYRPDIPFSVTINEAVEIAKRYGGADSGRFINGILDKLAVIARRKELPTPNP
mgnify:CR=1 FL=1